MRYWHPYIADSLAELAAAGCDRVVTVSLSPFESKVASGAYREAIEGAVDGLGIAEVVGAARSFPSCRRSPTFSPNPLRSVCPALPRTRERSSCSRPTACPSDLVADDPYVAGLRRTADAIVTRSGWALGHEGAGEPLMPGFSAFGMVEGPQPWLLVYQSKGARPGAWLEPMLDQLIDAAGEAGVQSLVVCPIGFMTDHMETLFDLDNVAARRATEAGIAFVRASVPNDDELVVTALAEAVAELL